MILLHLIIITKYVYAIKKIIISVNVVEMINF